MLVQCPRKNDSEGIGVLRSLLLPWNIPESRPGVKVYSIRYAFASPVLQYRFENLPPV